MSRHFSSGGRKVKFFIASIYIVDLLFTGDDEELLEEFKRSMKKKFDMTDLS